MNRLVLKDSNDTKWIALYNIGVVALTATTISIVFFL